MKIDESCLIEYSAKMRTNPDLEQKMKGLSSEMRDYIKGLEQTVDIYKVECDRLIREKIQLEEELTQCNDALMNEHQLVEELLQRDDS